MSITKSSIAELWNKVRASAFAGIVVSLFSGWEPKEKIIRPVVVNLLTAFLIFLTAVVFKNAIYSLLFPRTGKDWPIYCILEPEPNNGGEVKVDLFVVNADAEGKKYSKEDLQELAQTLSEKGPKISPLIQVSMKDYLLDEAISEIRPDEEYNKEKGSAVPKRLDPAHWEIEIAEIRPNTIMKFIISTTEKRGISSRASLESLPVKMSYARSRN